MAKKSGKDYVKSKLAAVKTPQFEAWLGKKPLWFRFETIDALLAAYARVLNKLPHAFLIPLTRCKYQVCILCFLSWCVSYIFMQPLQWL